MNETVEDLCFRVTLLDIAHDAGSVVCLVPQTKMSAIELAFAFTHDSFLEWAEQNGFSPFPAGDISDLIIALQKNMPENSKKVWVLQDEEEDYKIIGMSALHMVDVEHDCKIHCQTSLPFNLTKNTAVIMCSP